MTEILPHDIQNKNLTKSNNYRFQLKRTPHLNYFCQDVVTPSMVGGEIAVPSRFNQHYLGGDKLDYSTLTLTFKIDEDFRNYQEIFDWLVGINSPQNHEQYKNLISRDDRFVASKREHNIFSDGALFVLTNSLNVNLVFNFVNLFPIGLSGINFSSKGNEALDATVTFRYDYYSIDKQT